MNIDEHQSTMHDSGRRGKQAQPGYWILAIAVLLSTYFGWRLFWFLTDDAYIGFRYISNSILGHGYVWNAPPFRPVEGYTSFLWIALLDGIWRLFGVEPPDSANNISLFFTYLTLALGALIVGRMRLNARLREHRLLLLTLIFIGVLSNRTFLAWTSSGLETAMFNFLLLLWIVCVIYIPAYSSRWLFGITATTALIYLTRPDGILTTFTTVILVGMAFYTKQRKSETTWRTLAAISPLLVIPSALLLRYRMYGEFLPNTYYAKRAFDDYWIQSGSGLRYFLSFVIEYSLWIWFACFLLALLYLIGKSIKRPAFKLSQVLLINVGLEALIFKPNQPVEQIVAESTPTRLSVTWFIAAIAAGGLALLGSGVVHWGLFFIGIAVASLLLLWVLELWLVEVAAILTLGTHTFYYTVLIGGDHFEFRVYSHLILLIFISFLWILNRLAWSANVSCALFLLFIFSSWPIPWAHWDATQEITTRQETFKLKVSVAEYVEANSPLPAPTFVLDYLQAYDEMQFWLIERSAGMRHQEHKVFHEYLSWALPSREMGLKMDADELPVIVDGSVGVISWVLPKVNIIDTFGLNDYAVARSPEKNKWTRQMAHDRFPAVGYVDCFQPNVSVAPDEIQLKPRAAALTADTIRECERLYDPTTGLPAVEQVANSTVNALGEESIPLQVGLDGVLITFEGVQDAQFLEVSLDSDNFMLFYFNDDRLVGTALGNTEMMHLGEQRYHIVSTPYGAVVDGFTAVHLLPKSDGLHSLTFVDITPDFDDQLDDHIDGHIVEMDNLRPEQLVKLYYYFFYLKNRTDYQGRLDDLQARIQAVPAEAWQRLPLSELRDLLAIPNSDLNASILRHIPSEIELTEADKRPVLRYLGHLSSSTAVDNADSNSALSLDIKLLFESLDRASQDHTVWLNIRSLGPDKAQWMIYDQQLPVSLPLWTSDTMYEVNGQIKLEPGRYELTFGFWTPERERLYVNKDNDIYWISLGEQIVER